MSTIIEAAAPLLRRQHALVTSGQLATLGVHPQSLSRLVARGAWERLDHALYGPVGVPRSWRRDLMAAVLLGPPGTVVSHRAAAALHGVGGLTAPMPEVTIPRGTRLRRPWLIAHESVDLELAEPIAIDGIPVTGLPRVAVDLGSVVSPRRYVQTVRELRHGHGVTSGVLLHTYLRHKARGRNGCGALRDWLDRYFDVAGTPESGIEQVVLDALLDCGMPAPRCQHEVRVGGARYRLDLAYPEVRLAIEVDGRQHDDLDLRVADARRTARLEEAGWTVVRIRSTHLASDLASALRTIRHLVDGSPLA